MAVSGRDLSRACRVSGPRRKPIRMKTRANTTPPAEKGMEEVLTVQKVLWGYLRFVAFQRRPNRPLGISQLYRSTYAG